MANGNAYVGIVNGAAALANGLKAAGLDGPFCVAVVGEDGHRLHDAIGRGKAARNQIKEEGGLCKCVIAGIEFRWPTEPSDGEKPG